MKPTTVSSVAAVLMATIMSPALVEAQEVPPCNVGDNRDSNNQCSQEDTDMSAIIFKMATEEKSEAPDMGVYVCTCGDANLQVVQNPVEIQGVFDPSKQTGVFAMKMNPLCPVIIGGMKILVTCTTN